MSARLLRQRWLRYVLTLPFLIGFIALLIWRAPDWGLVADAFRLVTWEWIVAAIILNVLSIVARSLGWRAVIDQALPEEAHPPFYRVFSAFSVGLLANAVLPGRIGELARVAVLTRHLEHPRETGATLVGTVFAHRVFDLFPSLLLVAYVLLSAEIPHWALTSLAIFIAVSVGLFAFAIVTARREHRSVLDEVGQLRLLLSRAREGLRVMRAPLPAAFAVLFQTAGWGFQLVAVYAVMRAFGIDEGLHVAALVLLLMNIATLLPLWPGNFGIVQAAVALPLVSYGVAYSRGFAFGIGLQVVEMSVGVGLGLMFLAREGLSFATLRRMPGADDVDAQDVPPELEAFEEPVRARAGVSR